MGGDELEPEPPAPAPQAPSYGYMNPYAGSAAGSWRGASVLGRLPESRSDEEDGGDLGYRRYGGGGYSAYSGIAAEETRTAPSSVTIARSNPLADALASLSESHFGAENSSGSGGRW